MWSEAEDFLARFGALPRRAWETAGVQLPLAAVQAAALDHPSAVVRRDCLTMLDHHANDESAAVFRASLRTDPVPRVRVHALHGLACERCRSEELCVADVLLDLVRALDGDPSPKVRHAAAVTLVGLAGRDERAVRALERAALTDADELVRTVARAGAEGRHRDVKSRKALRRRQSRPVALTSR